MQTPTSQVRDAVTDTVEKTTEFDYWAFVLGTPLRVTVIIVVAFIINAVARRLIRRFSHSIADGSTARPNKRRKFSAAERVVDPQGQDPVVQARRAQRARTVGSMLSSVATIVISTLAILMVLTELGFNLGPVLASAGIAGVAIGFGAQALVKDYLSGLFIVVEDQYGIGDTVDLGEAIGEVEEVGLRTTRVRGVDGTLWHVRNGEILRVGNMSQGWARAVMDIPVPYNTDRESIDSAIEDTVMVIRRDAKIAKAILEEPEIWGVQDMTGEAVTIRAVVKTEPNQQWAVARAFRAALKHQLDRRGIFLPPTQQAVLRTSPDPVQRTKKTESDRVDAESEEAAESVGSGARRSG
jgi:moderate conductance mechanosensitive channel